MCSVKARKKITVCVYQIKILLLLFIFVTLVKNRSSANYNKKSKQCHCFLVLLYDNDGELDLSSVWSLKVSTPPHHARELYTDVELKSGSLWRVNGPTTPHLLIICAAAWPVLQYNVRWWRSASTHSTQIVAHDMTTENQNKNWICCKLWLLLCVWYHDRCTISYFHYFQIL